MKKAVLLLAILVSGITGSCYINTGIKGNGDVRTESRPVPEDFSEIEASAGLRVSLIPGERNEITVEADENLLPVIETRIGDGKLKITTAKNIRRAASKKVVVHYADISRISASSGAAVAADSEIRSRDLILHTSSGASIKAVVFSQNLKAHSSSGASLTISGKAANFEASASSGSDIKAADLETLQSLVRASSGASINLHVRDHLEAKASSGARITYSGNPRTVMGNSSSGKIKRK